MPQKIHETVATLTATPVVERPGRFLIGLITPGQGSSGYFSPAVLEKAAAEKVWPAGTQMFIDHETESEKFERPERSVRDIAAVLTEDARWDGTRLVAEATVFGHYRDALTELKDAVGVSINAAAEVSQGAVDGKVTRIIERLVPDPTNSVDFVTRAGRGGSILAVLESARPAQVVERAIAAGVTEATANEQREALANLLKEAHGGERIYVWLRDFNDTTCWFTVDTPTEGEATWQQAYTTVDDLPAALDGDPIEVRPVTTYVPVIPAGQSTTTESKEDEMATTEVEESELAQLREASGRATALETERDAERTRAEEAERRANVAEAQNVATTRARKTVREANAALPDATVDRIVAEAVRDLLLTDEGRLDEAAFDRGVEAARRAEETYLAGLAESAGAGRIAGFGPPTTTDAVTESDVDKAIADAFGRQVKEA